MQINTKIKQKKIESILVTTKFDVPLELVFLDGDKLTVYFKNIQGQKNAWDNLYFYYRSFQNSRQPMFATNINGVILSVNKAFLDFYGFKEYEVIGKKPNILKSFRQSPSAYESMWRSILDPDIGYFSGNIYNRKKDGTEVYISANITAVYDANDKIIGFVATHSDLTKFKEYENNLHDKSKELNHAYKELFKIMSILSHDIRGQLNSIINYLELIKRGGDIQKYFDKAQSVAFSLSKFIKDTIAVAKVEWGKTDINIKRCHMLNLLKQTLENLKSNAEKKQIKINFEIIGKECYIGCDILKTEEIFINLIDNAIKYTPERGEISIVYENRDNELIINFVDSGPGISKSKIGKIFEPFYTEGNVADSFGLGLFIVKKYVDLHQWEVKVENRIEGGTIFQIIIDKNKNQIPSTKVAVIYDPANEFIDLFEDRFKSYSLVLYKTTNFFEFKKLYEVEQPHLIFVNTNHQYDELEEYLKEIKNKQNKIIGIYSYEPSDMAFFDKVLNVDEFINLNMDEFLNEKENFYSR